MTGAVQLADAPHRQAVQRRTIGTLVAMQASGNAAIASVIAVATLLAADLLGSDTLAGLAAAMLTCGAALVAVPLAQHMRRRGRRPGLVVAYAVAAGGATLAAAAGEARLFPLFVVGMFLIGVGQAANLAGRYVAADLALPERRARAISIVVWTGTLGAVFGPTFATLEKDAAASAGLNRLVGPLLFGVAYFLVAGAVVWTCMRPDPLVVAGGLAATDEPRVRRVTQARAAFAVIRQSAGARLGLVAMVVSQTCMVAVMTMTPLHMKDHGQADLSALVIAVHILGMYGLAPLVGVTADRVGRIRVIQVGAGDPRCRHADLGAGRLPRRAHLRRSVPARAGLELRADRRQHAAHRIRRRPRAGVGPRCRRPGDGGLRRVGCARQRADQGATRLPHPGRCRHDRRHRAARRRHHLRPAPGDVHRRLRPGSPRPVTRRAPGARQSGVSWRGIMRW